MAVNALASALDAESKKSSARYSYASWRLLPLSSPPWPSASMLGLTWTMPFPLPFQRSRAASCLPPLIQWPSFHPAIASGATHRVRHHSQLPSHPLLDGSIGVPTHCATMSPGLVFPYRNLVPLAGSLEVQRAVPGIPTITSPFSRRVITKCHAGRRPTCARHSHRPGQMATASFSDSFMTLRQCLLSAVDSYMLLFIHENCIFIIKHAKERPIVVTRLGLFPPVYIICLLRFTGPVGASRAASVRFRLRVRGPGCWLRGDEGGVCGIDSTSSSV